MNDREILNMGRTRPVANQLGRWWRGEAEKLEKKWGKYLWVPLDIPRIEPLDKAKFRSWWQSVSRPIEKRVSDIAGSTDTGEGPVFNSIDSVDRPSITWTVNPRDDLFIEFPELEPLKTAYPFKNGYSFSIWSSQKRVGFHRDAAGYRDLPCCFRTMIFDDNPESTLLLQENPTDQEVPYLDPDNPQGFRIPRLAETNSFAWNNVRVVHGSTFDPRYSKALFIVPNGMLFNIEMFDDLMTRSVEKYKEHCLVSDLPLTAFTDA